jgi:hypothetical protein
MSTNAICLAMIFGGIVVATTGARNKLAEAQRDKRRRGLRMLLLN